MADSDAGSEPAPSTGANPEDALGDAGKRALDAERKARRAAESRVAELEARELRRTIAADKGVPEDLIAGATREEMEAHADRLAEFRGDTGSPSSTSSRPAGAKPREKLRPGASNEEYAEQNPAKVADRILSQNRI
jgi:hypothetical protein